MAKKSPEAPHRNRCETTLKTDDQKSIDQMNDIQILTNESLILLQQSETKVEELAKMRSEAKLSNSRVMSVSKEIRELIKVLSQYCRN